MIESVSGQILNKTPTFCVINCGGVGIGVFISINTFEKLDEGGEPTRLLTHLHVREDALQLYGFSEESERALFRKLISVSGIGPRLAITILSGIAVDELVGAIAGDDYRMLTKIPGVGKKTAQRIVLELKEKVELSQVQATQTVPASSFSKSKRKINEAILALNTLGYRTADARQAVERILRQNSEDLSLEEVIKLALKEI